MEVRKWKTTIHFLPLGFGTEETTQENTIFMNTLKITHQSFVMYKYIDLKKKKKSFNFIENIYNFALSFKQLHNSNLPELLSFPAISHEELGVFWWN